MLTQNGTLLTLLIMSFTVSLFVVGFVRFGFFYGFVLCFFLHMLLLFYEIEKGNFQFASIVLNKKKKINYSVWVSFA